MRSIAILAAAAMLIGGVGLSLAQDAGDTPADPAATEQTQVEAPEPGPAEDDASDVAFTPSEEVKADTAVAFPTDI